MYKDANDGTTYEWDADKKAWFPVMTEDFLATYQLNYGFDQDGNSAPTVPDEPKEEEVEEPAAKKAKQVPQQVNKCLTRLFVYVSLPR